jgi:hypothetical protein
MTCIGGRVPVWLWQVILLFFFFLPLFTILSSVFMSISLQNSKMGCQSCFIKFIPDFFIDV